MTDASIPRRVCPHCKQEYPLTSEFWHKASNHKSGLSSLCKECNKAKARQWQKDNPERAKKASAEYYQGHSEELKAKAIQWRLDHPEQKRQNDHNYYESHKDEHLAYGKQWVKDHPEETKAIKQAYIDRDPARRKKQAREYRYNNPEKVKAQAKKTRIEHPASTRKGSMKRRELEKGAEGHFTDTDLLHLFEEQEGRCAYCGITLFWGIKDGFTIDHIEPISKGGSHWPSNLNLACKHCNSSRQERPILEWMATRGW